MNDLLHFAHQSSSMLFSFGGDMTLEKIKYHTLMEAQ